MCSRVQDEIADVSSLADRFQAACNACARTRCTYSRLLPMCLSVQHDARSASRELRGMLLRPAAAMTFTPLHRMRVYECVLAASLAYEADALDAPAARKGTDYVHSFRHGLLTIDQSRSLVPLQATDPLVRCPTRLIDCSPRIAHIYMSKCALFGLLTQREGLTLLLDVAVLLNFNIQ